jgi:hypothetical protein
MGRQYELGPSTSSELSAQNKSTLVSLRVEDLTCVIFLLAGFAVEIALFF